MSLRPEHYNVRHSPVGYYKTYRYFIKKKKNYFPMGLNPYITIARLAETMSYQDTRSISTIGLWFMEL